MPVNLSKKTSVPVSSCEAFQNTFFIRHFRLLPLEGVGEGPNFEKYCKNVILIYLESIADDSERCLL